MAKKKEETVVNTWEADSPEQTATVPNASEWGTPITPGLEVEPIQADDWQAAVPQTLSEVIIDSHGGTFEPAVAKILVYGESGTGKTRFASTFPNIIFADIDKGMSSVTEVVDRVSIDDFKQLEALYAFLAAAEHPYETVVIDTLNEMQRIAMHATVEDFPMIRRSYDDLPSMSDYGKMLHDMLELTRSFISLPMRVILVAQVNSRVFETDTLQPQLVGKNSAREVARKMDVIGYIYKSEKEDPATSKKLSEMSFDATEYVTKDRSFKLPSILTDPNYNRMTAFWK